MAVRLVDSGLGVVGIECEASGDGSIASRVKEPLADPARAPDAMEWGCTGGECVIVEVCMNFVGWVAVNTMSQM